MRILSATADAAEWDALWSKLPDDLRDVHFCSSYARVQEVMGGKAILAAITSSFGFVAQPFLMQPINATGFFDLRNLYGYGGPITTCGADYAVDTMFRGELFAWAQANGVIAEYCCLHPLLAQHQLPLVKDDVLFTKDAVVIDNLAKFDEAQCARRVRRALKSARKDFIVIESEAPLAFSNLYDRSMERLQATERWRFNVAYWHSHGRKQLGARWFFVIDTRNGSAGLFRRGLLTIGRGRVAYAHFLGSDGELRHSGLDELLYYSAARRLADEGYERFHLGGGLTDSDDDPLLAFKKGFSDSLYRVGSYRRVFQPEVYDFLVDQKKIEEKQQHGRVSTESWFPEYRRAFA